MDFSQLNDNDLKALTEGRYQDVSDSGLKVLTEGQQPSLLEKVKSAVEPVTKPISQVMQGYGQMTGLASQTSPEALTQAAYSAAKEPYNKLADIAKAKQEALGNPGMANAVSSLRYAPDVATALAMPGAAEEAVNIASKPLKAVRNVVMSEADKAAAGEAIGQAQEAVGIKTRVPGTKQIARDMGLPKGTQQWSDVVNTLSTKLEAGEKVDPQTLVDFVNKGNELYKLGQIPEGTTTSAAVAKAMKLARTELNNVVPGRATAAEAMAQAAPNAARLQFLKSTATELAKKGLVAAGLGTLAKVGWDFLK